MAEPICIIGDSITGGVVYLSDSAKYTHWKDSFVNLLGASLDTEMKNHSKFGCTSGAALKRLERYSKDIAACPNTLVMLGGNDSDFNWPAVAAEPEAPHDCNTPVKRFRECYNAVLDRIIALQTAAHPFEQALRVSRPLPAFNERPTATCMHLERLAVDAPWRAAALPKRTHRRKI